MIRAKKRALQPAADRSMLRRRVRQMVASFNKGQWAKCFALIDPKLRTNGRVELPSYAASLAEFHKTYGTIQPWHIRINLHLEASKNKQDARPFAYVYIVWRDQKHEFHMFRERWINDGGNWFTRVVGLVPNQR